MFSSGTKMANVSSRRDHGRGTSVLDSPVSPLTQRRSSFNENAIPNRPSTGTPAPWAPRLSVLARVLQVNKSGRGDSTDPIKPVYVGEFPQMVVKSRPSCCRNELLLSTIRFIN